MSWPEVVIKRRGWVTACDALEVQMRKFLLVCAVAVALMASAPAQAATIIDFGSLGPGGSITFSGGVWTGTNIPVPVLNVFSTPGPVNFPGFPMTVSAELNFVYGNGQNSVTIVSPNGFAPAGMAAGEWFLTGSFNSFAPNEAGGLLSIIASGPDTKNPAFLTYLGLPVDAQFALAGFVISADLRPGSWVPFSTDMSNTLVPEPGSMLLLGTGLIGLAGVVRRRIKK